MLCNRRKLNAALEPLPVQPNNVPNPHTEHISCLFATTCLAHISFGHYNTDAAARHVRCFEPLEPGYLLQSDTRAHFLCKIATSSVRAWVCAKITTSPIYTCDMFWYVATCFAYILFSRLHTNVGATCTSALQLQPIKRVVMWSIRTPAPCKLATFPIHAQSISPVHANTWVAHFWLTHFFAKAGAMCENSLQF